MKLNLSVSSIMILGVVPYIQFFHSDIFFRWLKLFYFWTFIIAGLALRIVFTFSFYSVLLLSGLLTWEKWVSEYEQTTQAPMHTRAPVGEQMILYKHVSFPGVWDAATERGCKHTCSQRKRTLLSTCLPGALWSHFSVLLWNEWWVCHERLCWSNWCSLMFI